MLISSVWRGIGRIYFIAGLVFGGAGFAALVAAIGTVTAQHWTTTRIMPLVILPISVLTYVTADWILSSKWGQNQRQVPEAIVRRGPRVGAFQFGIEMGTGTRTFATTTMPHVLLFGIFLFVQPLAAALVGAAFGLGRAIVPFVRSYDRNDLEWSETFEAGFGWYWRVLMVATWLSLLALTLAR